MRQYHVLPAPSERPAAQRIQDDPSTISGDPNDFAPERASWPVLHQGFPGCFLGSGLWLLVLNHHSAYRIENLKETSLPTYEECSGLDLGLFQGSFQGLVSLIENQLGPFPVHAPQVDWTVPLFNVVPNRWRHTHRALS
ncbi:hypothetical protein CEXT_215581 [Caerostris extrusa]|uniref:Uncharacterized protein n=1 Tax=Caerostris extrusa TaxID=172846 RepID=A0AAV4XFM1_CAEEX|nr:hypothetical protein CEXT_215581 [Caerostris extrusa]